MHKLSNNELQITVKTANLQFVWQTHDSVAGGMCWDEVLLTSVLERNGKIRMPEARGEKRKKSKYEQSLAQNGLHYSSHKLQGDVSNKVQYA